MSTAFILMRSVYKKKIQKYQKEKQEFQKEILLTEMKTQEKVFNEIGSELHDNINQMLTATRLMLNMVLHKGNIDEKSTEHIQYCETTTATAIEEIRKIVSRSGLHMHYSSLDESINRLIAELKSIHSISFSVNIKGTEVELPHDTKISIYRILQESLNNIIKHANAKNVIINLYHNDPSFTMIIQDDGKGFDITSLSSPKSYGIKSIKNRASSINATIALESRVNGGTTVKLTI
jgi:signal transduction histidine kinase